MKKTKQLTMKTVAWTIPAIALLLTMNRFLGYERAELIAFGLLIGISIASMK